MKTKKSKKGSSTAAVALASATTADTSRWEELLAGGGSRATSSSAHKPTTTAVKPVPGKVAPPRSDKLPRKNRERTASKAANVSGTPQTSMTRNWEMLLMGGTVATGAATVASSAPSNGHTSNKKKTKKGAKGIKRPRTEIVQTGSSSSSSSSSSRSNGAAVPLASDVSTKLPSQNKLQPRSATAAHGTSSNGVGGCKAGTKRKRPIANGATGSPAATAAVTNGRTALDGVTSEQQKQHKQQRHSETSNNTNSKWPRSNVLNLAFQAQKEEAAAAAATAASGTSGSKANLLGADKGRGSRAGGRGGAERALTEEEKARYVALDCEMVGVGPRGCRSALARCCLVDWDGNTIYDKHVTPNERVTDFRTFVSGVKANHLKGGLRLRQCQEEVAAILKDRVLVGHALKNDMAALMMSHPARVTRDTATYRPYQKAHGKAGGKLRPKSLKILSEEHLDRVIQTGQHNPAEDARAAMDLYKLARFKWEKSLSAAGKMRGRRAIVDQQGP
ncbi:unnamed protein product [Pylaiella littoralis]